jgi:hypothetical protein
MELGSVKREEGEQVSRNPHKFRYAEAARLLKVGRDSGFRKPILELDSATGRLSVRDGDCDGGTQTAQPRADADQSN